MPLAGSDSTLSAALRAALLANPDAMAVNNSALTALCDCIASTVVAHVVANAVVLPVGVPGLIAPGGLTPAPVTGAGTIG